MITYENACSIVQQPETLDEPIVQDEAHVLERRHPYKYQERPTYWCSTFGTFTKPDGTKSGMVILPDDKRIAIPTGVSLTYLLDQIAKHTAKHYGKQVANLYLVAGRAMKNRPRQEWFSVFHVNGIDEKLQWKRNEPRFFWNKLQAEYERDGFKVYLYGTGNYFGEESDLDAMYEVWSALEEKLQQAFHIEGYPALRSTPALTGKELLIVSLPKERQYTRLPDDILELITHNFGQARIETFTPKQESLENGVYVTDGRWMYAHCISHLPTGPCYHNKRNEFIGVTTKAGILASACPGFYSITARVPDNWQHIGLIKASQGKTITDESGYYPNTPGETFANWTTANELALALNHGWHIQIHERIIWPHELTDPFAKWRKYLVELREQIEQEPSSQVREMLKDAIRAILLHTIGSFHQFVTWEERFTPRSGLPILPRLQDTLGNKSWHLYSITPKGMKWKEAVPLPEHRQRFIHPEWSATVWGRARARLAGFALRLPFEDIISLRTDSVWSASLPELPEDTGKPGVFRIKEYIPGPWNWPNNGAEMRAYVIKHHIEQGDTAQLEDETNSNEPEE